MFKPILYSLVLFFCLNNLYSQQTTSPRRIEVLFLGDNGHHKPMERFAQIAPALGAKGINFTYSDELKDLNGPNLAKFDAIMVYANWDNIDKFSEKAILDFVASGKGILPIHCASYCFRNSAEYVKMVGGQFWRHTMDTVQTNVVSPYHETMRGLKPIKSFDETYLHSQLQPDNNVLMMRPIGADQAKDKPSEKFEPYTWTRKYGLGNVFYTAYGHDENTWSNTNFQQMILNGILFVVQDNVKESHKALNPKPFEYKEAFLPNYEKREGPQLQQLALTPEESMKHIQIPPDFNLSLFASEPNVQHPIAMAWDERGRLYVLITKDYPNERKDTGGTDFILICEDTNGDGKADKFTKFAEDLSIPTGLVFANGGIVVSQAPHMLFLKDTNGDDKADVKKILFSGFGTGDTHAGPSNLHYGMDNWIWGCVGYSGYEGAKSGIPGDTLKFGQALFRFKTGLDGTEGPKLEWMTSTSNNTWGMGFNEAGDVFGSTANNAHGWYMAIPHKNFLNPGFNTDNGGRSTDTHKDMKTITPKVRQVDVFGGYTAAAGHNFYTARSFPKNYWNQIAFVAEPTGHVLHQNLMVKKGTNYEDKEAFNLMAGADEWFSPVFAEVGPDGAVWVADWYSFIIQHNPRPDGFKMGVGNAYETDLRDYTHGRIYRVGYNQAAEYKPISLNINNSAGLIQALQSDNMFWRNHAQRLLVERGQTDIIPELIKLINNQYNDELGLNTAAIHAIWVLNGLNSISNNGAALQAIINATAHPSWAVRKNAIQVLPNTAASAQLILERDLLADTEPIVVMNALLKLNQCPLSSSVENAIFEKMESSKDNNDRWLPDAYATALTGHNTILLKKYLQKKASKPTMNGMVDHSKMNHNTTKTAAINPSSNQNTISNQKVVAKKGIDLIVKDLKFDPSNPSAKENTKYVVEVQNLGLDSLKKGQVVMLKINISGEGQTFTIVSHVFNAGIASNETVTISKNTNGPWSGDFAFSNDKAGEYTFSVSVDYENKIVENDEKNNTLSKKLTVLQAPTLALVALERAVKSFASYHPADSIVSLLKPIEKLGELEKTALIKGISTGWNYRKKATLSNDNQLFMTSLSNKVSGQNFTNINKVMAAWGLKSAQPAISPDAIIINIKTVVEAMKFDKKEFTVKAGKEVIINIENPDAMQHNLVIGKTGSLNIIGNAADKMITQSDAAEKNYVPAIPQIIAATPLINANSSYQLKFTVPNQVGNYPFICTFPGHWRLMNGIMKVVK
ncbi:MAG: PVC-type heme-binding CxxCH protein [Bacteroidota bacterium]